MSEKGKEKESNEVKEWCMEFGQDVSDSMKMQFKKWKRRFTFKICKTKLNDLPGKK